MTSYGNYSDYSGPSKAPASATHVLDPRLDLLAALIPGIFTAKRCLDIGCNAGSVSCQLVFDFAATSVTGVDIDPNLVKQAEKLLALRACRVRPPTLPQQAARVVDYFPISAVLTHGYRIEPASEASRSAAPTSTTANWPCVDFQSADWVTSTSPDVSGPYDVILALSVIKWIHLEHLDQGLQAFFAKCSSSLRAGGHLVIELQTWDSYQKAVRPNTAPHFSQNLKVLHYRPETSFDELLADVGLDRCATSEALPRRVNIYRKH
ncbi:S-adenosyl-L-methionine-dependent methyltransferase [Plenodomus tracheiphilus IPT5]|uniref:RNA methyltransferase n=1 Tax=Plenodomus tracheiphilus IPT5 TaxID=1408161 RepID=A0A6A7AQE0_9PLEO|nr:S-adenosyl-L-methionine-dependent methyltransferase [Plenodomus tracheiphilus IPT5]